MRAVPGTNLDRVACGQAASIFRAKTEGSGHVASSTWAAAAAGPAALAIGTAIRTPFDIVEQRRQLVAVGEGGKIMHMTPRQHIAAIYRAEGLPAVLCGASATFLVSAASHLPLTRPLPRLTAAVVAGGADEHSLPRNVLPGV